MAATFAPLLSGFSMMQLSIEQLSDTVQRLTPVGRWDIEEAASMGLKLTAATETGGNIILDLSQVEYLSSMGIRSLIMGAKAANDRGKKIILLAPRPSIADALTKAAIDRVIPLYYDLIDAIRAART
jgi:anti-anti-sigma factor